MPPDPDDARWAHLLIEAAIARGSQSLLMVPEINLTPQLEARFLQRFPGVTLVSLHSGLSNGERCERWLAALAGDALVVLGLAQCPEGVFALLHGVYRLADHVA